MCSESQFDIGNLTETEERELSGAHRVKGVHSVSLWLGLGGEAGLLPCRSWVDRHFHASLRVYTVDIINNKIKQLVAVVVLVGASPVV